MTPEQEQEWEKAERLAQELLTWIYSKTDSGNMQIVVLARTLALKMAYAMKPGVTVAQMTRSFTKGFGDELKRACAFAKQNPAKPKA
ncbi:MAG: hypothetical protein V4662_17670 [Verrucomicrobiota bacterium]